VAGIDWPEAGAMRVPYPLHDYVRDLRTLTSRESDPARITDLVAPLARKFAEAGDWFRPEYRQCDAGQGFGVHLLHEEPNHDLAIFAIAWLPGRGTTPHNHKTWAVVLGIEGQEHETSYERVDNGLTAGYAELKRSGEQIMSAGDIACCYPEHIHAVRNVGKGISISMHTYGRHINYTGRSEFDIERKCEKAYVIKVAEEHARA
jgi:predicted metal-dependent enzyme (double-stranded beta helix superfamily)